MFHHFRYGMEGTEGHNSIIFRTVGKSGVIRRGNVAEHSDIGDSVRFQFGLQCGGIHAPRQMERGRVPYVELVFHDFQYAVYVFVGQHTEYGCPFLRERQADEALAHGAGGVRVVADIPNGQRPSGQHLEAAGVLRRQQAALDCPHVNRQAVS